MSTASIFIYAVIVIIIVMNTNHHMIRHSHAGADSCAGCFVDEDWFDNHFQDVCDEVETTVQCIKQLAAPCVYSAGNAWVAFEHGQCMMDANQNQNQNPPYPYQLHSVCTESGPHFDRARICQSSSDCSMTASVCEKCYSTQHDCDSGNANAKCLPIGRPVQPPTPTTLHTNAPTNAPTDPLPTCIGADMFAVCQETSLKAIRLQPSEVCTLARYLSVGEQIELTFSAFNPKVEFSWSAMDNAHQFARDFLTVRAGKILCQDITQTLCDFTEPAQSVFEAHHTRPTYRITYMHSGDGDSLSFEHVFALPAPATNQRASDTFVLDTSNGLKQSLNGADLWLQITQLVHHPSPMTMTAVGFIATACDGHSVIVAAPTQTPTGAPTGSPTDSPAVPAPRPYHCVSSTAYLEKTGVKDMTMAATNSYVNAGPGAQALFYEGDEVQLQFRVRSQRLAIVIEGNQGLGTYLFFSPSDQSIMCYIRSGVCDAPGPRNGQIAPFPAFPVDFSAIQVRLTYVNANTLLLRTRSSLSTDEQTVHGFDLGGQAIRWRLHHFEAAKPAEVTIMNDCV